MATITDGFSKICDDNGVCHCDWRLTIYGCEEEVHMRPFYIVLAVLSGVIGVTAGAVLYHRKVILSQTIFDWRIGVLRPKPIESLILFAIIFNLLRMIHAIIIVTDAAPNVAFRSFLFEVTWHYGIGAFACYFFGVAHTIYESNRIIYDRWVGAPIVVDVVTVIFLFGPHITNNICSIAAGIYSLRGDVHHAEQFTNALYWLWTFYTGCLGFFILYAGIRLLKLLRHHLLERNSDIAIENVKLGILKVKIYVIAGSTSLLLFAAIMIIYASSRIQVTLVTVYNVAMASVWMYNGATVTIVILFGIILNPRMVTLANNFGSTDDDYIHDPEKPTSGFNTSYTVVNMETSHRECTSGAVSAISSDGRSGAVIPSIWNEGNKEILEPNGMPDQIEVDQLHYNAMTNIVRPKQPHNTFEDNHRYPKNDNDRCTLSSISNLTGDR